MNKETVTVRILEGGKTCRELNPLVKPKEWKVIPTKQDYIERAEYKRMEESLRTWEISGVYSDEETDMVKIPLEGQIREAEIINGKAVII